MGYYGILDRAAKGRDEGNAFQVWTAGTTSTKHGLRMVHTIAGEAVRSWWGPATRPARSAR